MLVVEDDSLISMMLEEFLEDLGCDVVGSAANLREGLRQAGALALDFAVLDVNLAGEMSYPIAQLLLARKVPFLFATGYGSDGLPVNLRGAQVLAKPFDLRDLQAAMQRSTIP